MDPTADPGLRLAPHAVLLHRSDDELQVGVEPSVVVPRSYAGLIRRLVHGEQPERLERSAREQGLHPQALPDLLSALRAARLLRPAVPAAHRAVRVVGAGELGRRTAQALVAAGFAILYLVDLPERSTPEEVPRRPSRRSTGASRGPDRVDVLTAQLARGRTGVRVLRSRHFTKPEGDAVALTVVVADGPEPDRLVPDLLREHGAPHLLVRCSGDEAVVGPLVVPGATPCVRCTDLARRDADPRWPWLLEQLTRLVVPPAPTPAAWAAVTTTIQALAFLDGGSPETLGHTLELGEDVHRLRLRSWDVHPECPCRWGDDAPAVPDRAEA